MAQCKKFFSLTLGGEITFFRLKEEFLLETRLSGVGCLPTRDLIVCNSPSRINLH